MVEYLPSPSARRVAPVVTADIKKRLEAAQNKKDGVVRGRKRVSVRTRCPRVVGAGYASWNTSHCQQRYMRLVHIHSFKRLYIVLISTQAQRNLLYTFC